MRSEAMVTNRNRDSFTLWDYRTSADQEVIDCEANTRNHAGLTFALIWALNRKLDASKPLGEDVLDI